MRDEVGDLAGDDGGLARTRAREHQRDILVGGDRRRLLVHGRRGEHTRRGLDDGGTGGGDVAGVGLLPGGLECPETGERLDAGERPARALGQVPPRQRTADAQDGGGDVRPQRPAPGLALVVVAGLVAREAFPQLCELGGQLSGSAGSVLAQRPGELLGIGPPEPGDGAGRDAAGLADVEDAAVERNADRAAVEEADESDAGRGDGTSRFGT